MFGYTKTLFWVDEIALLTKLVPVLFLLLVSSIWFGWSAEPIENNSLSFIVTLIVYLMRFFPTVGQGLSLLMKIVSDAKSGKDITKILNTQQPKVQTTLSHQLLGEIKRINFQNVCFSYKEESKEILKNVTLAFKQGKSYALVGKSGIGKSTLVDILLNFHLPSSGKLSINSVPISDVSDFEIRKKIILVSQEAAIFDDTVINNICLGKDASYEEVVTACKSSGIHDVIVRLKDGYNTRLQYRGNNLSGGQLQRIGIARVLLRKPDVIIFDESTNALDNLTKEFVIANILKEYSKKIVIFITHDSLVMSKVDEVLDLEKINLLGHGKAKLVNSVS